MSIDGPERKILQELVAAAMPYIENAAPHEQLFNGQDHRNFHALDDAVQTAKHALAAREEPQGGSEEEVERALPVISRLLRKVTSPEGLRADPLKTACDVRDAVRDALAAAREDSERPGEGTGKIGNPYTTSDGSDDPNRASAEGHLSQRCPINTYPGGVCDLPPGHSGLHQSGSEEERLRRAPLNICRCGHDIRWHRIAAQVGTRMTEAGTCAHPACSCSFFHPPSRRNLHVRDTEQEHGEAERS